MPPRADPRLLHQIGLCIAEARRRAELTQEEAAGRASIDAKRWQRLEAGAANPTIRTLARVAAACGTDFWALVAGAGHARRRSRPRTRAR